MSHTCQECFQAAETHYEECAYGCKHWPPLCCPGCPCGSFARAHPPQLIEAFTGGVSSEMIDEAGGPHSFALLLRDSGCNCEPCSRCARGEAHDECDDYTCLLHDAEEYLRHVGEWREPGVNHAEEPT